MTPIRGLLTALFCLAVGLGSAGCGSGFDRTVGAQAYPGGPARVTLSATSARVGDTVTVTVVGLAPSSEATARFGALVLSGTTDADGTWTIPLTVPSIAAGPHDVVVSAANVDGSPITLTTTLQVAGAGGSAPDTVPAEGPDPGTDDSSLPPTGRNLLPYALSGLILVSVGAALVFTVKSRRQAM